MKKISIGKIILAIVAICLVWFIFFRTVELTITYDGLENTNYTYGTTAASFSGMARKNAAYNAVPEMAMANVMWVDSLSDGAVETEEEKEVNPERYRENKFYRVDTKEFNSLVEEMTTVIKELNGTIKINQQNSNKKVEYGREFHPRYQELEFTVDNKETDLEKIEKTLGKWGEIRISNSNITSIEQELTNYEQQLKEMEEARKALQESKDKDWIAKQDSDLAKRSERIKNQIENAKKQSTYKTYTINIYEVIKFRVNALQYWYSNNYELKDAVSKVLPYMILVFAIFVPVVIMLLLFIMGLSAISRRHKQKLFDERLEMIKEKFTDKEVHFDIKM